MFRRILVVVVSSVRVLTGTGYLMRLLPAVGRTWCVSSFFGHILATKWAYVALQPYGMEYHGMKWMVLVPPSPSLLMPWARRPNSCVLAAFQATWLGPWSS